MDGLIFSEIELAEDVKNFVSFNSEACESELKKTALSYDDDDFLKVTKQIASPLKIIKIEKVTEDMLDRAL